MAYINLWAFLPLNRQKWKASKNGVMMSLEQCTPTSIIQNFTIGQYIACLYFFFKAPVHMHSSGTRQKQLWNYPDEIIKNRAGKRSNYWSMQNQPQGLFCALHFILLCSNCDVPRDVFMLRKPYTSLVPAILSASGVGKHFKFSKLSPLNTNGKINLLIIRWMLNWK